MKNTMHLIGYASGIAAADTGCSDGPVFLQQADLCQQLAQAGLTTHWLDMLYPDPALQTNVCAAVADICTRVAKKTRLLCEQQQLFAVLGGDHTSAIGTWSGVAAATKTQGPLGLIWIDAHMDSHTPETTESGQLHGMPLACLLGYGAPELTNLVYPGAKLLPEHVSLIGIRSYERGEAELIARLGVRVYHMTEIKKRGLATVWQEAVTRANSGTAGYGISLDLDALDPREVPGVGSPAANGIHCADLCAALTMVRADPRLRGIEIAEFNPHHDRENKTVIAIQNFLTGAFR